ncbi:MAG TPA: tetratricopeptide repeat protein [Chloroflexia bacterium]|nr:tetratricopeptide repeat protein [Chloroflexia bacterium]
MSKKTKRNDPRLQPRPRDTHKFQDLTTERYFKSQMTKAQRLSETNHLGQALEILNELAKKYPDRAELFNLLGTTSAEANDFSAAREALEKAITLAPPSSVQLTRYNLAQAYLLSGYPFLAFEQSQQLDCEEVFRQSAEPYDPNICREFKATCEQIVIKAADERNQVLDRYLQYALLMDRGRLALEQNNLGEARSYFEGALKIDSLNPVTYNNLVVLELEEGDLNSARTHCRLVLEKLDPQNRHALCNMIRLQLMLGQRQAIAPHLERLNALAQPATADEAVQQAEVYAALEDDAAVLRLVTRILNEFSHWDGLAGENLRAALLLGAVACANLGDYRKAKALLAHGQQARNNILADRLNFAIEHHETGPRPSGRFYYFPPAVSYPEATRHLENLLAELRTLSIEERMALIKGFVLEYPETAPEIIFYVAWINLAPDLTGDLLIGLLASEVPGAVELVRRLAFGRAGDDHLHINAMKALRAMKYIGVEEKVRVWFRQYHQLGTIEELTNRFHDPLEKSEEGRPEPEILQTVNRALELVRRGQFQQAIGLYRAALKKQPGNKYLYQNLSAALANSGDLDGAMSNLQQALTLDPDYYFAQIALARLWIKTGRLAEAEELAGQLEKKFESYSYHLDELAGLYRVLVVLYRQQNRQAELNTTLAKLREVDPELLQELSDDQEKQR